LPEDRKIAVICASGYPQLGREQHAPGARYKDVENVAGGMTAFTESK
jgi:rhodanese-related sulfurtransferase